MEESRDKIDGEADHEEGEYRQRVAPNVSGFLERLGLDDHTDPITEVSEKTKEKRWRKQEES